MARNKYIYTMSQAVMVVKSNKEKGGTWTGTTENLKKAWVPLLVRDCSEEGNQALIQAGGIPLANDKVPYSQLLTQGTQSRENFVTTATASTSLQSDLFADQLQQTIGKSDYIKEVESNKECISDTPTAVLDESDETLKPAYGVIFGLFQDTLMQLSQGRK